jgi:hypothetical protein
MNPSRWPTKGQGEIGLRSFLARFPIHQRISAAHSSEIATDPAHDEPRAQAGRDSIAVVIARTRKQEAVPVETQVAAISPRNRARAQQTAPASSRSDPNWTTRSTVAAGTDYVCEARQTSYPSAMKRWIATATPWHLVGWINHPNRGRVCSMSWAIEMTPWVDAWAKINSSKKTINHNPFMRRNRTQLPITVGRPTGPWTARKAVRQRSNAVPPTRIQESEWNPCA